MNHEKMTPRKNSVNRQDLRQRKGHEETQPPARQRMEFDDFYRAVRDLVWSFLLPYTATYHEYCTAVKKEMDLYHEALRSGPRYMDEYRLWQSQALNERVRQALVKDAESYKAQIEEAWTTGDPEFDAFRMQVRRHDFWFDYTDDGEVWRRGRDERAAIEKIAQEKDGIYATFWRHYQAEQIRQSEEAVARQRAEKAAQQ